MYISLHWLATQYATELAVVLYSQVSNERRKKLLHGRSIFKFLVTQCILKSIITLKDHYLELVLQRLRLGLATYNDQKKKPGHSEERTRTGKDFDGACGLDRIQATRAGWGTNVSPCYGQFSLPADTTLESTCAIKVSMKKNYAGSRNSFILAAVVHGPIVPAYGSCRIWQV